MTAYFFEFTAHIDETRRPKDVNFPTEVHIHETYDGIESKEQLVALFNERVTALTQRQAGIAVFPDASRMRDAEITFDQRIYIPWHMITHFRGRVSPIAQKAIDEGVKLAREIDGDVPDDEKGLKN